MNIPKGSEMTRFGLLVLGGLMLAAGSAVAAEGIELRARTSGELAELCGAKPGSTGADAKINFCHGYAQGAVAVRMRTAGEKKPFCFPNPMPSRTTTMNEFVAWVKSNPANRDTQSLDGLFKFLGERHPCK